MSPVIVCPQCGHPSSSDQLDGLCPRCLLATACETVAGDISELDSRKVNSGGFEDTLDSGVLHKVDQVRPLSESVGEYELIEEIARGGMGVVYRARHKGLNRIVALKMILSGQFASEADVRRFYLEAESAANLDHPNIVPIYEIGQHDGHHFFSMKLVEGGSLADKMGQLRGDPRSLAKILASVSRAAQHAHMRGVLHRDLKPANILLDENQNPLVSDLGLAKQIQSESDLTGTGTIVGTPAYMPPEQASAEREVTTAADVFSIGAILYQGLVGHPPHQGQSPIQILMKAAKGEVTPPRQLHRSVDRTLELICMKCLQKDPQQRYSSAGALAEDLENWLDGKRVTARPPSMASVASELFYGNLRSAIGAAVIGTLAGLIFGCGILADKLAKNFGPDSSFSLEALYEQLPSMPQQYFWLSSTPPWMYKYGILASAAVFIFIGWVLAWTVRPKSLREAIALSMVAGTFMTLAEFGGTWSIAAICADVFERQREQVQLLVNASLLDGEARETAVEALKAPLPELAKYEPKQQAELLAKNITVTNGFMVVKRIWVSLLMTIGMCLIPCVGGTVQAHRLCQVHQRWWRRIVPYIETMSLLTAMTAMLVFEFAAMLGFARNSDGQLAPFALVRMFILFLLAMALVPSYKLWRWHWRWLSYPILIVIGALGLYLNGSLV